MPPKTRYFYPRSPCGERLCKYAQHAVTGISIHALLAESDHANRYYVGLHLEFLSTLSLRRATRSKMLLRQPRSRFLSTLSLRRATAKRMEPSSTCTKISIHALLAESDAWHMTRTLLWRHFYPRSPCGERPALPGWWCGERQRNHLFSRWICYFYPRSPCGERLANIYETVNRNRISIHALLAESDPLR